MSFDKKRLPNLVPDKHLCCGCAACGAVCPKGAIDMIADDEGFWYPEVDKALCIGCLLCEKVCAFKTEIDEHIPSENFDGVANALG